MNTKSSSAKALNQRLRAFARVELTGEVMIHNEEDLFIAPLANLSAGGCFISQLNSIPLGTEVKVVVRSGKLKSPVQAQGVVVRVENQKRVGTAIEFTSIAEESRDLIQTLVYEHKVQSALKIL